MSVCKKTTLRTKVCGSVRPQSIQVVCNPYCPRLSGVPECPIVKGVPGSACKQICTTGFDKSDPERSDKDSSKKSIYTVAQTNDDGRRRNRQTVKSSSDERSSSEIRSFGLESTKFKKMGSNQKPNRSGMRKRSPQPSPSTSDEKAFSDSRGSLHENNRKGKVLSHLGKSDSLKRFQDPISSISEDKAFSDSRGSLPESSRNGRTLSPLRQVDLFKHSQDPSPTDYEERVFHDSSGSLHESDRKGKGLSPPGEADSLKHSQDPSPSISDVKASSSSRGSLRENNRKRKSLSPLRKSDSLKRSQDQSPSISDVKASSSSRGSLRENNRKRKSLSPLRKSDSLKRSQDQSPSISDVKASSSSRGSLRENNRRKSLSPLRKVDSLKRSQDPSPTDSDERVLSDSRRSLREDDRKGKGFSPLGKADSVKRSQDPSPTEYDERVLNDSSGSPREGDREGKGLSPPGKADSLKRSQDPSPSISDVKASSSSRGSLRKNNRQRKSLSPLRKAGSFKRSQDPSQTDNDERVLSDSRRSLREDDRKGKGFSPLGKADSVKRSQDPSPTEYDERVLNDSSGSPREGDREGKGLSPPGKADSLKRSQDPSPSISDVKASSSSRGSLRKNNRQRKSLSPLRKAGSFKRSQDPSQTDNDERVLSDSRRSLREDGRKGKGLSPLGKTDSSKRSQDPSPSVSDAKVFSGLRGSLRENNRKGKSLSSLGKADSSSRPQDPSPSDYDEGGFSGSRGSMREDDKIGKGLSSLGETHSLKHSQILSPLPSEEGSSNESRVYKSDYLGSRDLVASPTRTDSDNRSPQGGLSTTPEKSTNRSVVKLTSGPKKGARRKIYSASRGKFKKVGSTGGSKKRSTIPQTSAQDNDPTLSWEKSITPHNGPNVVSDNGRNTTHKTNLLSLNEPNEKLLFGPRRTKTVDEGRVNIISVSAGRETKATNAVGSYEDNKDSNALFGSSSVSSHAEQTPLDEGDPESGSGTRSADLCIGSNDRAEIAGMEGLQPRICSDNEVAGHNGPRSRRKKHQKTRKTRVDPHSVEEDISSESDGSEGTTDAEEKGGLKKLRSVEGSKLGDVKLGSLSRGHRVVHSVPHGKALTDSRRSNPKGHIGKTGSFRHPAGAVTHEVPQPNRSSFDEALSGMERRNEKSGVGSLTLSERLSRMESSQYGYIDLVKALEMLDREAVYYYVYVFLHQRDVDKELLPFETRRCIEKALMETSGDEEERMRLCILNSKDRRLSKVELTTGCKIDLGELTGVENCFRGLPRRRLTITGPSYVHIANAISLMEQYFPRLMRNAVYPYPLPRGTSTKYETEERMATTSFRPVDHEPGNIGLRAVFNDRNFVTCRQVREAYDGV